MAPGSQPVATTPRADSGACPSCVPLGDNMEHRGHVWDIAFNPSGTLLAAAADDNTARVWELLKFTRNGDPLPHPKPVRAVAFSADGRSILTGCEDNTARIWQLGDAPAIGIPMDHSSRGPNARACARMARPSRPEAPTAPSDSGTP